MGIKAKLTTFDATMIAVSLVIGIGIFAAPQQVARDTGNVVLYFAAWIVGGLITIIGAMTFAEIGSRFSKPGAYYKVLAEGYDSRLAFMLQWASIFVVNGASGAGVAMIGAGYFNLMVVPPEWLANDALRELMAQLTASVFIIMLLVVNWLGIKVGALVLDFLTVIKIGMILFLIAAAFFFVASGGRQETVEPAPPQPVANSAPAAGGAAPWVLALGMGLIAVQFTCGGYQMTINFGADVRNARRRLPLATMVGMGIVVVLYLLINVAYYVAIGLDGIAANEQVAAAVAGVCLGPWGTVLISVSIVISSLGFLSVYMMNTPRTYYAMAEDRVLPRIFKRVNERTQVQEFGLFFHSSVMLGSIFLLRTFENIVNYVIFVDAITIAMVASTVFLLRRRRVGGGEQGVFKMPLYPALPAVLVAFLFFVSLNVLISKPWLALAGLGFVLAGYPVFLVMRLFNPEKKESDA